MIVELETQRVLRKRRRPEPYIPPFSAGAKCSREHCRGDLVMTPRSIRKDTRPVITCLLCGREYIKPDGAYVLKITQESEHNGRGRYN